MNHTKSFRPSGYDPRLSVEQQHRKLHMLFLVCCRIFNIPSRALIRTPSSQIYTTAKVACSFNVNDKARRWTYNGLYPISLRPSFIISSSICLLSCVKPHACFLTVQLARAAWIRVLAHYRLIALLFPPRFPRSGGVLS